jgi:hypothetical protein
MERDIGRLAHERVELDDLLITMCERQQLRELEQMSGSNL